MFVQNIQPIETNIKPECQLNYFWKDKMSVLSQ